MKYLNIILGIAALVFAIYAITINNVSAFCGWTVAAVMYARLILEQHQNKS